MLIPSERNLRSLCLAISGVLLIILVMTGVTYADSFPGNIADTPNSGALSLTNKWTGTAAGTLDGTAVNWYTGYGFNFTYNGTTYEEKNSYCIDEADAPSGSGTYFIESLKPSMGTQYLEAAWLIDQVLNNHLNPVSAQAAIWEIMFSDYSFISDSNGDSADYIYKDLNTSLVAQAKKNYGSLNIAGFYIATSDKYQDYLFYDGTPSATPIPNTMLIFGMGLLGLLGIRNRVRV